MNQFSRQALLAGLTGLAFVMFAPVSMAEEAQSTPQEICAQQAEEDGFEGEDKQKAIQACLEDMAAAESAPKE